MFELQLVLVLYLLITANDHEERLIERCNHLSYMYIKFNLGRYAIVKIYIKLLHTDAHLKFVNLDHAFHLFTQYTIWNVFNNVEAIVLLLYQ